MRLCTFNTKVNLSTLSSLFGCARSQCKNNKNVSLLIIKNRKYHETRSQRDDRGSQRDDHEKKKEEVKTFLRNPEFDPKTKKFLLKNSRRYKSLVEKAEKLGLARLDVNGKLLLSSAGHKEQKAVGLGDVFLPPKTHLVAPLKTGNDMFDFIQYKHKDRDDVQFITKSIVWEGHTSSFQILRFTRRDFRSNTVFDRIQTLLSDSTINVIVMPLTLSTHTPDKNHRHRNMIIINKINKTVERYDPWGYTAKYNNPHDLDRELMARITEKQRELWSMITPSVLCPRSFQLIKTPEVKLEGEHGACVMWSSFWVDLRLSNPNKSASELTAQFKSSFGTRLKNFERSYAYFMHHTFKRPGRQRKGPSTTRRSHNDDDEDTKMDTNDDDDDIDKLTEIPVNVEECEAKVLDCPSLACSDFCSNTVGIWVSGLWHQLWENVSKDSGTLSVEKYESSIPVRPQGLVVVDDKTQDYILMLMSLKKSSRAGHFDRSVMFYSSLQNDRDFHKKRLEDSKVIKMVRHMARFMQKRKPRAKIGIVFETPVSLIDEKNRSPVKPWFRPVEISSWDIPSFNQIGVFFGGTQFIKKKQTQRTRMGNEMIDFPGLEGIGKNHFVGIRSFDF